MILPVYDGYIFDLDGTIYLGDTLLPAARQIIPALRASGRRVAFLSNNPTHTRYHYAAKLTRLGIVTAPDEIVNSSYVLVQWLRAEAPQACLYVIGETSLIDELTTAGFQLSEKPGEITFVVASFDRTFSYYKLQVAFDAIRAGAKLIATNADRYCPVPGGGQPDAAAVIAAIEACTGTTCVQVMGKPSPIMARAAGELLGVPPDRCLIIGDRLETDILMGLQSGMATALVLTGATRRVDLVAPACQPHYVLEGLHEVFPMTCVPDH